MVIDFWEVIKRRKSSRSFDRSKDVSENDIKKLLEAANCAPSAGAIYPTEFKVIRDQEVKNLLAKAAFGQYFIAEAPVVIVVIADIEKSAAKYGKRGRNLYAIQDAAAATENLLLAATALDLGTCWVGAFDEDEVSKILKLEKSQRPLAIIPVGWAR
jgi:nitroreductase